MPGEGRMVGKEDWALSAESKFTFSVPAVPSLLFGKEKDMGD